MTDPRPRPSPPSSSLRPFARPGAAGTPPADAPGRVVPAPPRPFLRPAPVEPQSHALAAVREETEDPAAARPHASAAEGADGGAGGAEDDRPAERVARLLEAVADRVRRAELALPERPPAEPAAALAVVLAALLQQPFDGDRLGPSASEASPAPGAAC